jgi:hypothetical protein
MHSTRKKELKREIKRSKVGAKANAQRDARQSWMAPKRAPGVTQKLMIRQAVLIDELHKIDVCLTPTHSPHASTSLYSTAPLPKAKPSPESAAELLKTKRQHNSDPQWVRRPRPDGTSSTTSTKKTNKTTTTSTKTMTTTAEKPRSRSSNPIKRLLVRLEKRTSSSGHCVTAARPE